MPRNSTQQSLLVGFVIRWVFLKRVLVILRGVVNMNRDELRTQEACILYLQFDSLKCWIRAKYGVENDEKRKNANFEKSAKIVIFNKKPPN